MMHQEAEESRVATAMSLLSPLPTPGEPTLALLRAHLDVSSGRVQKQQDGTCKPPTWVIHVDGLEPLLFPQCSRGAVGDSMGQRQRQEQYGQRGCFCWPGLA